MRTKKLKKEDPVMAEFASFRRSLRQLLWDFGVPNNPGWTESDIVEAIRTLVLSRSRPPERPAPLSEPYRYLLCQCRSPEHSATVFFEKDEWFLSVHLSDHRSFLKRLWTATKYLFRRKPSRYGHWDEMILRREDLLQLKKMLSVVN